MLAVSLRGSPGLWAVVTYIAGATHAEMDNEMSTTITLKEVDYEQPEGGAVCSTKHAWARVPAELSQDERAAPRTRSAVC